jgi:hypothetical protein
LAEDCNKRQQLDNLLATYNLASTIDFPTIIDNIYIDRIHIGRYIACPVINGLSDHDTQLIKLENVFMQEKANKVKIVRNFKKPTPYVILRLNSVKKPGLIYLMKVM